MSDAEAQAIDSAVAIGHSQEYELLDTLNALRNAYPQPVSSAFLMACVRIAENANALSRYEKNVAYDAGQRLVSNEVRMVQAICGLTETQTKEAENVVYFFRRAGWDLNIKELLQDHAVVAMRDCIDRLRPDECGPETWVPELMEQLAELAETYAPVVRTQEAFYGILEAAMRHSAAMKKFENREAVERFHADIRAINESVRLALASGKKFKFNDMSYAVTEDEPEFHYIAQTPTTREEYLNSGQFGFASAGELPTVAAFDRANTKPYSESGLRESGLSDAEIESFNYEVRFACEQNLRFKISGTRVIIHMEDEYTRIEGPEWNRKSWLEQYDTLPPHRLYPDS